MIQQVGKYVLKSELGKGAMGSVWLSEHPGLAIPVAVKILDPALAAEDPDYMDRFIKEGKLAASINHQNVVRIIDAGQDGDLLYLVMELIDGADAKQLVEHRGPLPLEEVLELAICTAEALKEAHSKGIVHRDIKPDNILVTSDGKIKVADLGIAKQVNDDYGTTMAGTTIGTPYYIAPEQAMDSSTVDRRCDIYALGGTLYHLLTGTVPFTGPSAMSILMKHTQEELQYPKERRADLPDSICSVICKMMEKDPDDRYQNCSELLKDLRAVKNKKPTSTSKKKKQLKAPAKKRLTMNNLDKDLADLSSTGKSIKKNVRKKKTSSSVPVIGAVIILLAITGFAIFKNRPVNKNTKTAASEENSAKAQKSDEKKENSTVETQSQIKVLNTPHPYYLEKEKSALLQWEDNWTLFVEFNGTKGTIAGKAIARKWVKNSKALYIDTNGKLAYVLGMGGSIKTSKIVNDGKYHMALLVCKNGKLSFYIDGELSAAKNIFAKDEKEFQIKIGAGSKASYDFNGHIKRVAFWNVAASDSKLKHFLNGRFDISQVPFYYENNIVKEAVKQNGDLAKQLLQSLRRDNPNVKIDDHRIKLSGNDLSVNLNDLNIKNISSLKGMPVKQLHLMRTQVDDFAILKELPTVELDLSMLKSTISLKNLNNKSLRWLRLMQCNLEDIYEFKKFDLYYLAIKQHPLITRTIQHMNLYRLDMDNAELQILFENLNKNSLKELKIHIGRGVKDISKLKGFNLKVFHLTESPCEDLSVLKGMPLEDVALMGTNAADLSPLKGAPLKSLILNHRCKDLSILKSFKQLQEIAIAENHWTAEIEFLRNTNVKIEGYSRKREHWWLSWGMFRKLNSRQFWEEFDKKKGSNK